LNRKKKIYEKYQDFRRSEMIVELEHIEGVYKKIMKERKGIQELSQSVTRNFYGMVIMLCLLILLSTIYRSIVEA